MKKLSEIKKAIENKELKDILITLSSLPNEKVVFSSSLGYEDQIITHLIFSLNLNISVFTIDTGRLFPETHAVLNSTLSKYKRKVDVFFPDTTAVQKLVTQKGPLSFYESIENRKECCYVRKVEPLKRALQNYTIWITGIRAEQSPNRKEMLMAEWDEVNTIIKIHPLLNWKLDEVKDYIKTNNIPYNSLHDKGFFSIGCQPCTRAVKQGEDFRAGRWWWEEQGKKECGLHS